MPAARRTMKNTAIAVFLTVAAKLPPRVCSALPRVGKRLAERQSEISYRADDAGEHAANRAGALWLSCQQQTPRSSFAQRVVPSYSSERTDKLDVHNYLRFS